MVRPDAGPSLSAVLEGAENRSRPPSMVGAIAKGSWTDPMDALAGRSGGEDVEGPEFVDAPTMNEWTTVLTPKPILAG